jgi:hypothetical protein
MARFFQAGFDYLAQYLPHGKVMINNIYSPDLEFKQIIWQVCQPLFELVSKANIPLGISRLKFRKVDLVSSAGMIMNI